jgi:hypothetical protein
MYFEKELEIHKEIFPLATPQDQLWHLCEELNEMQQAKDDTYWEEWGDALFVAISLQRFEHTKPLAELMLNILYFSYSKQAQSVLDDHLAKVIEKVKSRKYYFVNEKYEREKNV